MAHIHPTALVSPEAQLAPDVQVGPSCVISGKVTLGPGVQLMGHNYVTGPTTIGEKTVLYPFVCVGFGPQDVKFKPGDPTAGVVIGKNCILREAVTIHAATKGDVPTRLGDNVFMLVNSHVGHDAQVGNNVTMVNGSALAGHVTLGDNVLMGGNAVIHQFCRVGRLVAISGDCGINKDVPPFCVVSERNRVGSLNLVGLRRAGIPREQIGEMARAFHDLFVMPRPNESLIAELKARGATCPPLLEMAEFVAGTKRGICSGFGKPPRGVGHWLPPLMEGNAEAGLLTEEED